MRHALCLLAVLLLAACSSASGPKMQFQGWLVASLDFDGDGCEDEFRFDGGTGDNVAFFKACPQAGHEAYAINPYIFEKSLIANHPRIAIGRFLPVSAERPRERRQILFYWPNLTNGAFQGRTMIVEFSRPIPNAYEHFEAWYRPLDPNLAASVTQLRQFEAAGDPYTDLHLEVDRGKDFKEAIDCLNTGTMHFTCRPRPASRTEQDTQVKAPEVKP